MNFLPITLAIFIFLMLTKIFLSGLYLRPDMGSFAGTDIALAEEEAEDTGPTLDQERLTLRKKEKELKDREAELERKEQELLPLRKEIDSKIDELYELQTRLTAFAKELAEREQALKDAKIGHLVALYSAMDAARAAAIMDKLQLDTVVLILANMKGKSAGQILSMMEPERGALISENLSKLD